MSEHRYSTLGDWFTREAVVAFELSAFEGMAYVVLANRANRAGECWLSHDRIAAEGGMSPRRARSAVGRLVEVGLVEVVSVKRGRTNRYRVVTDRPDLPSSSALRAHEETKAQGAGEDTTARGAHASSSARGAHEDRKARGAERSAHGAYPPRHPVPTKKTQEKKTHLSVSSSTVSKKTVTAPLAADPSARATGSSALAAFARVQSIGTVTKERHA